jgi:hypothetical protein
MNIFDELTEIYSEIDSEYAAIEAQARAKRHFRKETKYQKKRELNDQAYFLFMFTRFEDRIKQLSNDLINEKYTKLTNWNYKRTWDILYKNKQNYDIHFLDRVALLTPIGQSDFNLIDRYYTQRNNIAHGKSFTIAISIPIVVTDFKRLFLDLKQI